MDEDLESHIRNVFSTNFPRDSTDFENSFASRLLKQLARYFEFMSPPNEDLRPCYLREVFLAIQHTDNLFRQLSIVRSNLLGDDDSTEMTSNNELGDVKIRKKVKQGKLKQSRPKRRRWSIVDLQPFQVLDAKVPESIAEAEELEGNFLEAQRSRLMVFLNLF